MVGHRWSASSFFLLRLLVVFCPSFFLYLSVPFTTNSYVFYIMLVRLWICHFAKIRRGKKRKKLGKMKANTNRDRDHSVACGSCVHLHLFIYVTNLHTRKKRERKSFWKMFFKKKNDSQALHTSTIWQGHLSNFQHDRPWSCSPPPHPT